MSYFTGLRDCFDLWNDYNGFSKCVMVSGGHLKGKKKFQDVRLDWNIVGIAFAYFLWNLKHVMKKCLWSACTYDLTEVTRRTTNLRYQHGKVRTIVKILHLMHTPTLWHCRNKLLHLQSQTIDNCLRICNICVHIITIVFCKNVV